MKQNATNNEASKRSYGILLGAALLIVIATILAAFWRTGSFLPSWVEWNRYANENDINGNSQIESIELSGGHLSIIDQNENHYLSPNRWLISDMQVGDITADNTPELLFLAWQLDSDTPTFRILPMVPFWGFSQHILVCDYEDGAVTTLWSSPPLEYEAHLTNFESIGQMTLSLSNGEMKIWRWNDSGLVAYDENGPAMEDPVAG